MAKYEWRKTERNLYLPRGIELVDVPSMHFITIDGAGNPNGPEFADRIQSLYGVAYTLRMAAKRGEYGAPFEYTVYPLEGVWTTSDGSRGAELNKDALQYRVMIRQPDIIKRADFAAAVEQVQVKKPELAVAQVGWRDYTEGLSVQAIHVGPYDDEVNTFAKMQSFLAVNDLTQISIMDEFWHREVYLSDPRRTDPAKMRTLLRYRVQRQQK